MELSAFEDNFPEAEDSGDSKLIIDSLLNGSLGRGGNPPRPVTISLPLDLVGSIVEVNLQLLYSDWVEEHLKLPCHLPLIEN